MNIILWDYDSVWPNVWPQNKCRPLWPIFHGPVILPYILKTVWCMNILLRNYESVWPDFWSKNKCRSLWPVFHGPAIFPYILKTVWCMNIILSDNESVWPTFDLNINVVYSDLYFMVQWFCFISLRLFDVWTSYFGIESVWPDVWPQNKCGLLWPVFHGPVIFPYTMKTVWCMNIILWDYESVWHDIWPQNKCRSVRPTFYGPVILPYILNLFDIWTPYFGIMSFYDLMFYLR